MKLHLVSFSETIVEHSQGRIGRFYFRDEEYHRYIAKICWESSDAFETHKKWYDLVCGFSAAERMHQEVWIEIDLMPFQTEIPLLSPFNIELKNKSKVQWTPDHDHAGREIERKDSR